MRNQCERAVVSGVADCCELKSFMVVLFKSNMEYIKVNRFVPSVKDDYARSGFLEGYPVSNGLSVIEACPCTMVASVVFSVLDNTMSRDI